jgi:membrane-associated phospholipid phosphatase
MIPQIAALPHHRVELVGNVLLTPSRFDMWSTAQLGQLLGKYPSFDLGVQSGVRHHLLGGFWFAFCLFIFWVDGERPGGQRIRQSVLITMLGATLAILFAHLLGLAISWPPPSRDAALAHLYPPYLIQNINDNSFPSDSTALYAAVAAGIFSLNRLLGTVLFVLVILFVGLPRMFVGGHYPTDVFAGLVLGLFAYFVARRFMKLWLHRYVEQIFERASWVRVVGEFVVFVWIVQIGVEFAEFVWIRDGLAQILK